MISILDLFAPEALLLAISDGFVSRRDHPTAPLSILNYTPKCQFERAWTEVTRSCRGLIYDRRDDVLLARPFRKFFNYGERDAPTLDLSEPAVVTDKLDGSLGILYPLGGGWAVATRGSFDSEQARHATALWSARYRDRYVPPPGWTVLVEIVFPENRVVVDYGNQDELILLGAVDIETGRSIGPQDARLSGWAGPQTRVMSYQSLAQALEAPPRPNSEGLVVHLVASDQRVKLKQDDYVALHRIVTGLNERVVWEHLAAQRPLSDLLAPLPEEFRSWAETVAQRLAESVSAMRAEVESAYLTILLQLGVGSPRKAFALRAVQSPWRSELFLRLDGKEYGRRLWDRVYPPGNRGPGGRLVQMEDTA